MGGRWRLKMIEFQISDVSNIIDEEGRFAIADLILAWARFDSLVTQWTFRSFGMGADEGSIFIGNMDTKSKLDKIKALQKHFGHTDSVNKVNELAKAAKAHADIRNSICHKTCGGYSKSDPSRLIFSNGKIYPQMPGRMQVELIHLDQIRTATQFATSAADQISPLNDALAELQETPEAEKPAHEQ